jgi:hypothetical protein
VSFTAILETVNTPRLWLQIAPTECVSGTLPDDQLLASGVPENYEP